MIGHQRTDGRGARREQPQGSVRRRRPGAFTIIELIVVVTIIGLLLAMVLPAASRMWSQRNEAATYNMLRGLLESARTQAIRTGERGLFFFLDEDGTQRVVFIRGEPPDYTLDGTDACNCKPSCCGDIACVIEAGDRCVTQQGAVDRFRVVRDQIYTIPKPYRVAPDWMIENPAASPLGSSRFAEVLTNASFEKNAVRTDTPYYHRNFFTIVFNVRGEVVPNRNVVVHDRDATEVATGGDGRGDSTRLRVVKVGDEYWVRDARDRSRIDPVSTNLFDMVALSDGTIANFASVAGLLVYDETDLEGLDAVGIQDVLNRTAQPCFVNRYTGEVVFGRKGK